MDGSRYPITLTASETVSDALRQLHKHGAIRSGYPQLLQGQNVLNHQQTWRELRASAADDLQLVLLRPVLVVDISDNALGFCGIDALVTGMQGASLRALSLARTGLCGEEAGLKVAQLLQSSPSLESLDLSGNNGFGAISLVASGIDIASIASAMPTCYSLHSLTLADCSLEGSSGGRDLAFLVSMLPNLKSFNIRSNNHLCAQGLLAFAEGLSRADLGCSIQKLSLEDTGLEEGFGGDAAAQIFAKMPQLAELTLANNALGLAGLVALGDCMPDVTRLTKLDMKKCSLPSDLSSENFDVLVAKCPMIGSIDLEEEQGFDAIVSLQSLPYLRNMQSDSANLCLQHIKESGFENLDSLELGADENENIVALIALCASSNLRALSLDHGCLQTVNDGIALARLLAAMDVLESLSLYGNLSFGWQAFPAFAEAAPRSRLRFLNLGECGLAGCDSGRALASLMQQMPELCSLCLRKNHRLQNSGLLAFAERLSCHGSLATLDLSCCAASGQVGTGAILNIVEALPSLRTLSVSGNTQLQEDALRSLLDAVVSKTAVRSLSLASCGLSARDMNLQDIFFPDVECQLESLDLSGNSEIGALGLQTLVPWLPSTIQRLDLGDCGLESVAGGAAIAALVRKCSHEQR